MLPVHFITIGGSDTTGTLFKHYKISKVGQNSPPNHDEFLRDIKDYSIVVFIFMSNILYLHVKVFTIIMEHIFTFHPTPQLDTISLPQHIPDHLSNLTIHKVLFSLVFMFSNFYQFHLQSNLSNVMHVATKVHVILRRFAVLTWMHDDRELVKHVTLWNNTK